MGRGTILNRKHSSSRSTREGGWSLIELTVALFLLMAIALFGMKTMVSAFLLQNWSIGQSMTDAYTGIETANAQRYVFSDIENGGSSGIPHWGVYPAITTTAVTIGKWPSLSVPLGAAPSVSATVIRTYHRYPTTPGTVDPVTGAISYLLETYVLYQNGQQKYCKVSKVYRDQ
jgi:hypothetical protein